MLSLSRPQVEAERGPRLTHGWGLVTTEAGTPAAAQPPKAPTGGSHHRSVEIANPRDAEARTERGPSPGPGAALAQVEQDDGGRLAQLRADIPPSLRKSRRVQVPAAQRVQTRIRPRRAGGTRVQVWSGDGRPRGGPAGRRRLPGGNEAQTPRAPVEGRSREQARGVGKRGDRKAAPTSTQRICKRVELSSQEPQGGEDSAGPTHLLGSRRGGAATGLPGRRAGHPRATDPRARPGASVTRAPSAHSLSGAESSFLGGSPRAGSPRRGRRPPGGTRGPGWGDRARAGRRSLPPGGGAQAVVDLPQIE